jgi:hypothetical protein
MGFTGLGVTAGYLSDFLPPPQVGLMWAALSIGVVSVLYIAGAAIYPARTMFLFGVWLGVFNIIGVIAGPGWHSLIISLAGGGGGYVFGLIAWRQLAHEHRGGA